MDKRLTNENGNIKDSNNINFIKKKEPQEPDPRWERVLKLQLELLKEGLIYTYFGRMFLLCLFGGIYIYNSKDYTRNLGLLFILGSFVFLIGLIIWIVLRNKEYDIP